MKCDLCNNNEAVYSYTLVDGSTIGICKECGEILYGIEFKPCLPGSRLFQIIKMLEYIRAYHLYIANCNTGRVKQKQGL